MNIVDTIRKQEAQENRFEFNVGDTVRIAVKIVEGDTERIQHFGTFFFIVGLFDYLCSQFCKFVRENLFSAI